MKDLDFLSKIHKKMFGIFFCCSFKNKLKAWLVKINRNLMQALTLKSKAKAWLVKFSDLKKNKAKVGR